MYETIGEAKQQFDAALNGGLSEPAIVQLYDNLALLDESDLLTVIGERQIRDSREPGATRAESIGESLRLIHKSRWNAFKQKYPLRIQDIVQQVVEGPTIVKYNNRVAGNITHTGYTWLPDNRRVQNGIFAEHFAAIDDSNYQRYFKYIEDGGKWDSESTHYKVSKLNNLLTIQPIKHEELGEVFCVALGMFSSDLADNSPNKRRGLFFTRVLLLQNAEKLAEINELIFKQGPQFARDMFGLVASDLEVRCVSELGHKGKLNLVTYKSGEKTPQRPEPLPPAKKKSSDGGDFMAALRWFFRGGKE